jgi:hypothetical protein
MEGSSGGCALLQRRRREGDVRPHGIAARSLPNPSPIQARPGAPTRVLDFPLRGCRRPTPVRQKWPADICPMAGRRLSIAREPGTRLHGALPGSITARVPIPSGAGARTRSNSGRGRGPPGAATEGVRHAPRKCGADSQNPRQGFDSSLGTLRATGCRMLICGGLGCRRFR